jgi:hypothetical protein
MLGADSDWSTVGSRRLRGDPHGPCGRRIAELRLGQADQGDRQDQQNQRGGAEGSLGFSCDLHATNRDPSSGRIGARTAYGMRTYVRVTSKGSIIGQLQRALAKRDVLAVRSLAGELPSVPLPTAAEITLLMLEQEPESFLPAARRLLARIASERALPLGQLADVAAILAELERDPAMSAGTKLISLVQDALPQ